MCLPRTLYKKQKQSYINKNKNFEQKIKRQWTPSKVIDNTILYLRYTEVFVNKPTDCLVHLIYKRGLLHRPKSINKSLNWRPKSTIFYTYFCLIFLLYFLTNSWDILIYIISKIYQIKVKYINDLINKEITISLLNFYSHYD